MTFYAWTRFPSACPGTLRLERQSSKRTSSRWSVCFLVSKCVDLPEKKCQDPNCQAVKSSSLGQLKQSQDISSTNYMIWHMIHICNMLYIYIYMNIIIYIWIYIYIHMIKACLISDFIFCPSHGMMFRSRPRSAKLGAAIAKRRSGALRNRIVAKRQRCLKSFFPKKNIESPSIYLPVLATWMILDA